MKHLKKGRKFSREKKQREAMLRIMLGQLLLRKKIVTTETKAREVSRMADSLLVKLKRAQARGKGLGFADIRKLTAGLPQNIDAKQLKAFAGLLLKKSSGFTRVTKTAGRRSDGAKMAMLEIISGE